MLLCARVFELSDYRSSSFGPRTWEYQRRGFLALGGMSVYTCLVTQSLAIMFDLSYSRLSSLDPVLQAHPRRGLFACAGRQTHTQTCKSPQSTKCCSNGGHVNKHEAGHHHPLFVAMT